MASHFLSVALFGISSNIDCLAVGLSYGVRKQQMGIPAALIISLLSFTGTVLSMLVGQGIALLLPPKLPNIIGGVLIFAIGLVGIVRCILHRQSETARNATGQLSWKEAFVLGVALAANNAGLGIGARITGMRTFSTALLVLVLCLVFLYIGNRLGRVHAARRAGKCAECFANVLMMLLGIYEMLI